LKMDFETKMTIGDSPSVKGNDNNYKGFGSYDLPRPEGVGWQLKQVMPVYNNNKYLQYFWEREIEIVTCSTDKLKIKDNDINISFG
jgi:hypothetical protein